MSFKRTLFMLMSLTVLFVAVLAALSSPTEGAATTARPIWADTFVSDYEDRHGATSSEVMTQLLYSSNAVCGDLHAGRTVPEVWKMLTDNDHWAESSDQAATVIELSIKYYCPEEG